MIKKDELSVIVRQAGQLMLDLFDQGLHILPKKGNIATNADIAVEQFLIKELSLLYPHSHFITEESGSVGNPEAEITFVIDPIDGTINYVHGYPFFCVSVAVEVNNEIVQAFVYDPVRKELFYAQKGGGAWLNEKRIFVHPELTTPILIGVSSFLGNKSQQIIQQALAGLQTDELSIRSQGSSVLSLCYIACNRLQAVVYGYKAWWDQAAAWLIVQEAGGVMTMFDGSLPSKHGGSIIAANKKIHGMIKRAVE